MPTMLPRLISGVRAGGSRALLFAALLRAAGAEAQAVGGRVVAAGDRQPIPHTLLVALDEHGRQRGGVLSDSAGRYALRLPAPGRYTLRAERIGYETVTTESLAVGAGLHPYDVVLAERPFALEEVRAEAGGRGCAPRRDADAVYRLWSEVQKALRLTVFTHDVDALSYTIMSYERETDRDLVKVQREQQDYRTTRAAAPFGALEPAALMAHGFARPDGAALDLFGVDARVLLSPEFVEHYCFRIERSPQRELIGLGFAPIRRSDRTEVRGVLWVDRTSAELRYLTYEYLDLPPHLEPFGARGETHFRRLSTGLWVIERWWIRMPRVARAASRTRARSRYQLLGYREGGGVLLAAEEAGRATYHLMGGAAVTGRITGRTEATSRGPATVFLSGTPHTTTADSAGSFRILGVPAGTYAVAARDSLLDQLAVPVRLDTVRLDPERTTTLDIPWPTQPEILRAVCPGQEEEKQERNQGLLYGDVFHPVTRQPVVGAEVRVDWRTQDASGIVDHWRTAVTGEGGRYYLCWLALDVELAVRVATADGRTHDVALQLAPPIQRLDVR